MNKMQFPISRRTAVAALLAAASGASRAQAFPAKPVTLVVPYAAGGSADGVARQIAQRLAEKLGQGVVVDNRPGANGMIAMQMVTQAPPDGYTVLFSVASVAAMNPSLYRNAAELQRKLVPVSKTTTGAFAVLANNELPAKTLPELIAYAKAHPGKLSYGSAGNGSHAHLATALLCKMAGIDMVHVPYKGGSAVVPDLMAGNIQVFFDTIGSSLPHVKSGKVRALAVTSARRSPVHPELPAVAETVKGYETEGWHGLFAPAATPAAVVNQLSQATAQALQTTDLAERFAAIGFSVVGNSPAQFRKELEQETRVYADLINTINLRIE